jgi:hypothetical protein
MSCFEGIFVQAGRQIKILRELQSGNRVLGAETLASPQFS